MKINRSAKCSLSFLNKSKRDILCSILTEYSRCVNVFISKLNKEDTNSRFTKDFLSICKDSWLSQRMLQNAGREALDMVKSAKEGKIPHHNAKRMCLNANICQIGFPSSEFDLWLKLRSIGNKIKINIPLKKHRQFNKWDEEGKQLKYYIITDNYIQFSFEIETGVKKDVKSVIGIDTGIKHLATLSTGEHLGSDIEAIINIIKRKKQGSMSQRKTRQHLKQRIGEVAKQVCSSFDLIVVERLSSIWRCYNED